VLQIIQSDTLDDGDIFRGENTEQFVDFVLCIRALQVKYACASKTMSLERVFLEKGLNLIRVFDNGLAEASRAGRILESYESLPGSHVYFSCKVYAESAADGGVTVHHSIYIGGGEAVKSPPEASPSLD
jgi:hypothetical protein